MAYLKTFLLILCLGPNMVFGQSNYVDLEDDRRIKRGLAPKDPYGINEPLNYQEEPENLQPYQNIWRHPVPIGRMPTSDQNTLEPYNIDKPGIIRDW